MHFLLQVNLKYIPRVYGLPSLPRGGVIFVFYDPAVAPMVSDEMGEEPSPLKYGSGLRVFYIASDPHKFPTRSAPPMPGLFPYRLSTGYHNTTQYIRYLFEPVVIDSYPVVGDNFPYSTSLDEKLRKIDMTMREDVFPKEMYFGTKHLCGHMPMHTMFGHSKRRYVPSKDYLESIGREKLPPMSEDHILLFKLENEYFIKHEYVDSLPMGIWIKRGDLENLNFENVVLWEDQ